MNDSAASSTLLPASDVDASAQLLATILAAEVVSTGPGRTVRIGTDVSVRFHPSSAPRRFRRCSILIDEDRFDAAYGRLLDLRIRIWADPERRRPAEINHRARGRSLWFTDLDGHLIELATTPDEPPAAR